MTYALVQGNATRIPLPDNSVDLVFGSPPYVDARLYLEDGRNLGISRQCEAWVQWMLRVTTEARRVSRGPVVWVAAGVTRARNYQPACEGLMWEWWRRGGECQLYRPCYWHRVGIPGSGGKDWFRSDVEYVMCFKGPGPLPWSDNTALGHPPKWAPGGAMSHRLSDGTRRNQWGGGEKSMTNRDVNGDRQPSGRPSHRLHTKRDADGSMREQGYTPPALANPGNLVRAPFPEIELVGTLDRYSVISGETIDEIVRVMRKSIAEETLPGWWCRVLARVHSEEVLRSSLQGFGSTSPERTEDGRSSSQGKKDRQEEDRSGSMRTMRFDRESGGASQGWGCDEQRTGESGGPLHEVPQTRAQGEGMFHFGVYEALYREGLLLHALLAFQAARRSFGEVLGSWCPPESSGLIQGIPVGGGLIGNRLSHINEAPFPIALAEHFVRSLCPPGGVTLDPFSGSGTTVDACRRHGRVGLGMDLRYSQCDLGRRRLADPIPSVEASPMTETLPESPPCAPAPAIPVAPPPTRWYVLLVSKRKIGDHALLGRDGNKTLRQDRALAFDTREQAEAAWRSIVNGFTWDSPPDDEGDFEANVAVIPMGYTAHVTSLADQPRRQRPRRHKTITPCGTIRLRDREQLLWPEEVT